MEIHFANTEDIACLAALSADFERELLPGIPPELMGFFGETHPHYFEKLVSEKTGFILISREETGEISGFAALEFHDTCSLESLYVVPQYRKMGRGRALISHAKRIAAIKGYAVMTLHVYSANEGARLLYEKCGFRGSRTMMSTEL
ncbi:MAG: GNAT family N-acetyltransferase [Clostridiales bacterium]|nr:GNAT family N-acetyltransferase [Clostridiales bacterium]